MRIYNFKATHPQGSQLLVEGLADSNVTSFRRWVKAQGYEDVLEVSYDTAEPNVKDVKGSSPTAGL